MHRTQSLADASAYFDDGGFFADLQRRVAFRTESDTGAATPALGAYLRDELVPPLSAMGFACEIVENPVAGGGPFLIARRIEDPALPTVLSYGHGDVVSGQDAQWDEGLGPWALTKRGDRWYGRGTADNKGQHTIALGGLAAALQSRSVAWPLRCRRGAAAWATTSPGSSRPAKRLLRPACMRCASSSATGCVPTCSSPATDRA
jgi:acetylornithine deacetylase/succinyl-diaminopimelate desuccinylase-like protein